MNTSTNNAFFLIDKPAGITSFWVLKELRTKLWEKKIWHTGTLDPLATWCLLVATGNYTKLISFLWKSQKTYRATIQLDGTSPSYDSDTDITYISQEKYNDVSQALTQEKIHTLLQEHFLGNILQTPPSYSALKVWGKTSLQRILSGEKVRLLPREVEVLSASICSFEYPELVCDFSVSAGTYIRSLAHDLWNLIGTGGYISKLRRTSIDDLDISQACTLSDISFHTTISPQRIFWEKYIEFWDEQVYARLSQWQRVRGDFPFPSNTLLLLWDSTGVRYSIEYNNGVIHPRRKII